MKIYKLRAEQDISYAVGTTECEALVSEALETVNAAVEPVRIRAGIELPRDLVTMQFNLCVLLRRGYMKPKLTTAQLDRLAQLLAQTAPVDDDDDTPLAAEGSRRALHTFLTHELDECIRQTRGAAYTPHLSIYASTAATPR